MTPFSPIRLWDIPIENILGEDPNEQTKQTATVHCGGNEFFTVIEHREKYYTFGYERQGDDYIHHHQKIFNSLSELLAQAETDYHRWGHYLETLFAIDDDCHSEPLLVEEYHRFNGYIYGEWLACKGLEIGLHFDS